MKSKERSFGLAVLVLSASAVSAAEIRVVATSPRAHAVAAPATTLVWAFDRPVDPATVDGNHFRIFARRSGPPAGVFAVEASGYVVRFTPDAPFFSGEGVVANVTDILGADASPLRSAGYAHEFTIAGRPSSGDFELLSVHSVVGPQPAPRIYGGAPADLDGDGWVDLAIVNQTAADVRVLPNLANGSGMFGPFLTPTHPVGNFPSPNHTADFDHDGRIDLATANKSSATSSILLGNGDGTFDPARTVPMGINPSGLAAFDADGDGDWDIATANANSNHVNLALNDGTGAFTPQPPFESGGNREYGLAAVDANLDGIFDLLVGATMSAEVITLLGNGDGTYRFHATQSAGGGIYKLVPGDVDADGDVDVSVANGFSGAGAMLLGRGDGSFDPPQVEPTGFHTTATDLGDVDGDGDLDWILSVYGGGFWRVFENDGAGSFSHREDHEANANPACSIVLDVDNDRDLDIALLDEVTDDVTILENVDVPGDADDDGIADVADCDDSDPSVWSAPPAARRLRLNRTGGAGGMTFLDWVGAVRDGSMAPAFDLLRSENPAAFHAGEPSVLCLESGDARDTFATDDEVPQHLFAYLVVAKNACGHDAGASSAETPRVVRSCP